MKPGQVVTIKTGQSDTLCKTGNGCWPIVIGLLAPVRKIVILEIMHVSKSIYHQWDLQLLDMEYRFIPTGVLMELQDV